MGRGHHWYVYWFFGSGVMKNKTKKQRKLRKCEKGIKTKRMNKNGGFRHRLTPYGFMSIY